MTNLGTFAFARSSCLAFKSDPVTAEPERTLNVDNDKDLHKYQVTALNCAFRSTLTGTATRSWRSHADPNNSDIKLYIAASF